MKKIVLSIIVALIAITANAQVYVGGTFGVGSDKVNRSKEYYFQDSAGSRL